ncbi:MAG TPA: PEP-CTERM sorting domain-containing protein [Nitrospirota bacterium]|nr:PEP-CTERM sorting domain-containing protein [Nitrospirota bacterium]
MLHQKAKQIGRTLMLFVFMAISISWSTSFAMPVVTYTVNGSANNWTLDFSLTNNLGGSNLIYFFGLELPARDIIGTPAGWYPDAWKSWNNHAYGGSNIAYNDVWINENLFVDHANFISDGQTLSGFSVLDTRDLVAPTSVNWFAYGKFGTYGGGDNFNSSFNPGFEGITSDPSTAVPEPSTILLITAGLAGIVFLRRKKLINHNQ